jgi:membrane protein implicated in regulation of membrane protease activity
MMELWAVWWIWIVAALVMGIIEIFVPAFFFLGMAAAATIIGVGLAVGVLGLIGVSLPVLLFVFAVVSLVLTILLRRFLGVRRGQVKTWHTDIND